MSELQVVETPLDEDIFWKIIQLSVDNSNDIEQQGEILTTEIEKLSPEQMVAFKVRVSQLTNAIHTSEMWCAGYLINDGCSDDGFDYFKNWVVSCGKEIYYKAKENPDNLADCVEFEEEDGYEFEELDYVALDPFQNKTGKALWDYLPKPSVSDYSDFEFNWDEDDVESIKAICPKLFAKVDW